MSDTWDTDGASLTLWPPHQTSPPGTVVTIGVQDADGASIHLDDHGVRWLRDQLMVALIRYTDRRNQ